MTLMKKTIKTTGLNIACAGVFSLAIAMGSLFGMSVGSPQRAMASEVINVQDKKLSLETNKGVLLKLEKPAKDIFIANPNIADVQVRSPHLIYIFGKATGETTIYAMDGDEKVIYSANIHVSQNLERIREALKTMLPKATLEIKSINGMVILSGFVKSPGDSETAMRMIRSQVGPTQDVMNQLVITTPTQVNLRVKIAEVNRDVTKQLGFNWESLLSSGNFLFGVAQGANVFDVIEDPITGAPIRNYLTQNGSGSILGSYRNGSLDLNTIIDAMEGEGYLSVLAEPNLTAISGKKADFLAGGEYPVPVPTQNGQVGIQFRQFGVGLSFTPTVISENKIILEVAPEVSQLSSAGAVVINGISVPALSTRKASTTVELGSGQSFAIAGLIQNSMNQETSKIPGLGDIPILGALFRSEKWRRQETELVIIVTPYIVRPVDAKDIPLPTDGIKSPNDLERMFEGKTPNKTPRPSNEKDGRAGPVKIGRAGFKTGNF